MIHKKSDSRTTIAAFDFDGTITYRDSLLPFLIFSKGFFKAWILIASNLPILLRFLDGKASRQDVKESLLKTFFKGESNEELEELGNAFAKDSLSKHVRPEALHRISWHQKQGHRCVLISASIETYLVPWARLHGFDDVLASKLALDKKGHVTGKLDGWNCRGSEKIRRLQELLGPLDAYEIYAYGDSRGDKELLEAANFPFYRRMPEE